MEKTFKLPKMGLIGEPLIAVHYDIKLPNKKDQQEMENETIAITFSKTVSVNVVKTINFSSNR